MTAPRSRARRLLKAATFGIALAVPVVVLAYLVRAESGTVVRFDEAAVAAATDITRARPALHRFLVIWQELFQARWVNLAVSLVALGVWRRHGLAARAAWAFGTLMVAWGLGLAVKFMVQRARPVVEDALGDPPGFSFPSGHATNTTAAGIILVLLVWPLLQTRGRVLLTTTVALAVVVTALDRVFLGAHYPSDVVAGIALGAAMTGASWIAWAGRPPAVPEGVPPPSRRTA